MALQKTVVDLPFTTGLNLSADERLAPNEAMRQLQNVHFDKDGAALAVREGLVSVGNGLDANNAPAYPLVLNSYNGGMTARTPNGVAMLIDVNPGPGPTKCWNGQSSLFPDVTMLRMPTYDYNGAVYHTDYATQTTGNISVFAVGTLYKNYWVFVDNTTGAVRQMTETTAGTLVMRCTRTQETLILVERTPTTLVVKRVTNTTSPVITIETTNTITGLTSANYSDLCVDVVSTSFEIAIVETNSVTMNVYFGPANGTPFKTININLAAGAGARCLVSIGVDTIRNYIFVATMVRAATSYVQVRIFNSLDSGLAQVGSTTGIGMPGTSGPTRIGITPVCNPMKLAVSYGWNAPGTTDFSTNGVFLYSEGDAVGVNISANGGLIGKPFYIATGEVAVPVAPENGVGGGLQLVTPTRTIITTSLGNIPSGPFFDHWNQLPPSNYVQPGGVIDFGISYSTGDLTGNSALTVDRYRIQLTATGDTTVKRQAINMFGLAIFSGPNPLYFDGATTVNPAIQSTAPVIAFKFGEPNTPGGVVPVGKRSFTVVYEWYDNNGRLYRSPPAIPIFGDNTGLSGNQIPNIRFTLPTFGPLPLGFTAVLYATVDLGTVFHRSTSMALGPLADAGYNTKWISHNITDATLETNEILYTTGGILESYGMPPTSAMAAHQTRLFVVNPDDGQIWYTMPDDKALGPRFNPLLKLDPGPDFPTGLASFDDKLVIFKRTSVYAIFGQGPDNLGQNANYSAAQLISSDTGCIDPRTIVIGAGGVYFQGVKGFYVVTPGLQVQRVGVDVAALTDGNIYGWAKAIPGRSQLMFGRQGEQLLLDERLGVWSRYTSAVGRLGEVWNDVLTMTPADGTVFQQSRTQGFDLTTATPVPVVIETAWLKFSAIQGFERMWRMLLLGAYPGVADGSTGSVSVSYRVNYDETATFLLADSTLPAQAAATRWQLRYHMPHQKVEAVKFVITYSCVGVPHVFSGLSFEIAGKIGGFKKPHAVAP